MILGSRQKVFVERAVRAFGERGNILCVAPTGAGKTIMLSGVAGEWLYDNDAKACVLAHRDEITSQNEARFCKVNPGIDTSVFDARDKSWSGQATFAMVQTLSREANLTGRQPATAARSAPRLPSGLGLTRYQASCLLAFQFNKRDIQSRVFGAADDREAVLPQLGEYVAWVGMDKPLSAYSREEIQQMVDAVLTNGSIS